jgi:putative ABC transport system permease protein
MIANALRVALTEIRRNVMRSSLTVLGIVIGVGAVITMVTIGSGATVQVTSEIESLGSNLMVLTPGQRLGHGQRSTAPPFDVEDADAIRSQIRSVRAVAPVSSSALAAIRGNENWLTTVTGVTDGYFTVRDWPLVAGRSFTGGEYRAGRTVCVIGETVRRELFGEADPIGDSFRLGRLSCEVVGLLESKGQSAIGRDQDNLVLVPLRTFQRRVSGNRDVAMIQLSVRTRGAIPKATREIEELMRERRHIAPGEDDDFSVLDMAEITSMLTGTTRVMTTLLGAVAAVSLLVGGIGIMNIMLVSVTERTREIGIRLAIGALERDVLLQFLVEAVVLSSLGGIAGVALSLVASLALAQWMQVPFVLDLSIIGLSFGFAAAVGVVFGYFPARRAARLDPIEALRHE